MLIVIINEIYFIIGKPNFKCISLGCSDINYSFIVAIVNDCI